MAPESRCILLQSVADLDAHAAAYDALVDDQPGQRPPLLARRWISSLRDAYLQRGASLFFLALMQGERMVALLPLVLRSVPRRLPLVRKLQFFGQEAEALALVNFCADMVVRRDEDPVAALEEFRSFLFGQAANRWDLMELHRFCSTSSYRDDFERVFGLRGVESLLPGYALDLPSRVEDIGLHQSKNSARALKRRLNRLRDSGLLFEFELRSCIDDSLFAEIAALHSDRQNTLAARGRAGRDALFERQLLRAGLQSALRGAAAAGRLRIYTLRIGGELASVQILFGHRGEACAWLTAMNSRMERFSPSRLLLAEANRIEVERFGTRIVDHMPGFTVLKEEITNRRYTCADYDAVNISSWTSRVRCMLLRCARALRKPPLPRPAEASAVNSP